MFRQHLRQIPGFSENPGIFPCLRNGFGECINNVIDFHLTPLVSNLFYNRVNDAGCDTLELKSSAVSADRESLPRGGEIPLPNS